MKPFEFMYVGKFPSPSNEVDGHLLVVMHDDVSGKDDLGLKFVSDEFDGYRCCLTSGTPSHGDEFLFDESLSRDLGAYTLERRQEKSLPDCILYKRQ